MVSIVTLEKARSAHLKENGEICNRLKKGTRVEVIARKGSWVRVTWRNGKKKGWIQLDE